MNEDFQLIAEQSLRSLYLQMVDYYTESINKDLEISQNLLDYFNLTQTNNDQKPELNKSESQIEKFINYELIQLNPIPNERVEFETNDSTIKWLISRYNFFGIPTPPDGFLQIDDGTKSWWKTKSKLKNGFFTFVEVFNFDPVKNEATIGDKVFSFDEETLTVKTGAGTLGAFLQDKTKDAYIEYAKQNAFNEIISKNQISDKYMFALDRNSNSFHIEAAANGQTSKLYIRYFFNEFGQKLDLSVVEVQGVEKLKPIPGGIRKNYIVRNLFSGISGYEKYYKKRENKSEKTDRNIEDLKKVKKTIDISIEAGDISLDSRIAFVFNSDYEFLSFLDGENKNINNNELYLFLKTNKELNKIIVSLNAINCEFGTNDTNTATSDVGDAPSDYNHFVSSDAPYDNPTQETKAINYKAKRSELKFIGDVALRTAFDEIRKTPAGAAIADIYDTFLNKVDVFELARMFTTSLAPKIDVENLRKTYFKVFIYSLDMTELVDCVVLNAGRPAQQISTTYPEQEYDENGKPIEATGPAQTVVFQSSIDFERDLKTLLYGRFAFFYNIAASFDPDTFDFGNLPTASNEFEAVNQAAQALKDAKAILDDAPNAPTPEEEAALEEAYLQALQGLDDFLDKNFMYVLMVPESQQQQIYSTIVSNDPQYEYKPAFINNGLIEARDTSGFSPENFITTLFKNLINRYANQTEYFLSFYDNIAKKNKKLKDSSEIEKDIKSGTSSVGDVAKTSKNTLPEPINFGWYDGFIPTFDLNATFSSILSRAYDDAMKNVLGPIVDSNKAALGKLANGDPEKYNRIDPDLKAEYTSNDLIQNTLNGARSAFSSPREIHIGAISNVLKNNTISQVECLFSKIFSEIPIQTQLRFLTDSISPEDTDFSVMQQIFSTCGVDSDYTTVRSFFLWYNGLLNESGGINEILQKIEDANSAAIFNTDICDNNSEYINSLPFSQQVAQQLAQNESREAIKAIDQILSLLNSEARKNSAPNLFNCSNDPNKKPIFEDFYSDSLKSNFNDQITGLLKGINSFFNKDISKFKPTILKQNNANPLEALGDAANLMDFLNKANTLVTQNQTSNPDIDPTPYELQQASLENIIKEIFDETSFLLAGNSTITTTSDGLTVYRINAPGNIIYEIVVSTTNATVEYYSLSIDVGSTYIVARKDNEIFFSQLISSSPYDLLALYQSFLNGENPLFFIDSEKRNQLIYTDYPELQELSEQVLHEKFYSQQLLSLLYSGFPSVKSLQSIDFVDAIGNPTVPKGGATLETVTDPDLAEGQKTLLEGIINGVLLRFINETPAFKTKEFVNTPLQDLEAAGLNVENKNYQDGGLLMSDEIYKSYETLRKKYQCFINPTSTPDPHQVSKLKSLYESLFNVFIMEGFLLQFFSLGQEQLALVDNEVLKKLILGGITSSFDRTVNQIDNLQVDYTRDIDLIYHYEILDRKSKSQQNLIDPPEWNLETTDDKIIFLSEKYYDKIYNRIMSRISVSFGDQFSSNLETISNIFVKAPNGTTQFEMYDEVEYGIGGEPIPVLYGLSKGIITQRYVDIRQNGSIFKQLIKNELKFGFDSGFSGFVPGYSIGELLSGNPDTNTEYEDFEGVLKSYLPTFYDSNNPFTQGDGYALTGDNSTYNTPGYTQLFFTKATEGTAPNVVSAIPYAEFDVDALQDYIPRFESDDPTDWRNDFYRTQGKISKSDFNNFYSDNLQDPIIGNFNPVSLLKSNGPKTYYKKISAGVRMCLVLSYESSIDTDLTALISRYVQTLRPQHGGKTSVEAREIMKEKFGLYKNENGDNFLVIPLMQRETNFLEDLNNEWFNNHDDFEWWSQINSDINNHNFTPQKTEIRQTFESLYPSNAFAQILPLVIQEFLVEEYGDQLSNLFGVTKEEILRSIYVTKAIINNDWDFELPTDGTNLSINSNSVYIPLALSFIPIIIKLLATFTDPLWRTMWFNPGPQTAVGFLAKILDATE